MKSQSEIFGMAIVMVLITIGLLMYVSFTLMNTHEESLTTQYVHKQLPVLLNDALLQTHTTEAECYGEKMKDLLIKCGQNENYICSNGDEVCDYTETWIRDKLVKTVGRWKIDYNYTVYVGNDYKAPERRLFSIYTTNCSHSNINSETFFFRMSNGKLLNMKMDVCS